VLKTQICVTRPQCVKINLAEIGSEVDSSGSVLGIVPYAFEHWNKLRVPGEGSLLKIFATQE